MAPRSIKLLSSELRDQIAAGEVVERPSSVVKELVENALDAGARNVRVEIEGGGLDRIVVVDDGCGMSKDDALLSLERHATSKLVTFDELFRLSTFGFRGEALPSIASVSRFKLTTRTAEALEAVEITVVSGQSEVKEVGAPTGTTIEVDELFFNVPARRKFIKSVSTEAGHVGDTLLDLALSRHDVAVTLVRDGRVARQWLRTQDRGSRARDAIARTLQEGNRIASEFVHVQGERPGVNLEAMLSPPERARSGPAGLHMLVNGRAVRDRHLSRAVAMAYGSVLSPGRYPLGVLYLDVPTEEVDVNVHPQKAEVRFARGRDLYDDVTRTLGSALADAFRRLGRAIVEDPEHTPPPRHTSNIGSGLKELSQAMASAISPFAESGRKIPIGSVAARTTGTGQAADPWGIGGGGGVRPARATPPNPPQSTSTGARSVETSASPTDEHTNPPVAVSGAQVALHARVAEQNDREYTLPSMQYVSFPGPPPEQEDSSDGEGDVETTLVSPSVRASGELGQQALAHMQESRDGKSPRYGSLRFLAQVRATFLVCEAIDGIYVIDQHAAAERVNYARLRAQFQKQDVPRQQLLVPEIVHVSSAEAAAVDELRETFARFGVDAQAFGDGRVIVYAIPALMVKAHPARLLRDLMDELLRTGERNFSDAADLVLATMACHGSVRAGDPLHPDEAAALLRSLDDIDFAGYCPHGRPIVTSLSYVDLEKKVGRR